MSSSFRLLSPPKQLVNSYIYTTILPPSYPTPQPTPYHIFPFLLLDQYLGLWYDMVRTSTKYNSESAKTICLAWTLEILDATLHGTRYAIELRLYEPSQSDLMCD